MAQAFRAITGRLEHPAINGWAQHERLPSAAPFANPEFLKFLRTHFEGANEERLHVTYFDSAGYYLTDETLVAGLPHSAVTSARNLFGKALAADARGFILAHNHPSGICRPSVDDIRSTDRVRRLAAALGMALLDHLIVTKAEIYSMQSGRLL